MRAYQIEEKLERLEMAVEGLRKEVEGIKSDIRKAHAAEADGQAAGAAAGETPKKRTRKKAEPAE